MDIFGGEGGPGNGQGRAGLLTRSFPSRAATRRLRWRPPLDDGPRLPRAMRRTPRATCDQVVSGPMWPQQQACRTVAAVLLGRLSEQSKAVRTITGPRSGSRCHCCGHFGEEVEESVSSRERPLGDAPPARSLLCSLDLLHRAAAADTIASSWPILAFFCLWGRVSKALTCRFSCGPL